MSAFDIATTCSVCGQALVLPAHDLKASFACPRCGTRHAASSLVETATPLRAVPVHEPPAPRATPPYAPPPSPNVPSTIAFDQTMKQLPHRFQESAPAPAPTTAGGTQILPATAFQPPPNPYALSGTLAAPTVPAEAAPPPVLRETTNESTGEDKNARQAKWSLAARLTSALGDVAWWLHRHTYGHQLLLLSVFGAVVYVARRFVPTLYTSSLFIYASFLYLLLLARLWWVRDDDGNWSWSHFAERFGAVLRDALGGMFRSGEFSFGTLLLRAKLGLIAMGLGLVVLAPPLSASTYSVMTSLTFGAESRDVLALFAELESIGGWVFAVGFVVWLLDELRHRRPSAAAQAFKKSAEVLTSRADLPCFVDVRQGAAGERSVPAELSALVGVLGRWRPRRSDEAGYERSLVRFLEKELPGSKTWTQRPIPLEGGGRAELDVVVDDVLAIELKTGLRTAAEADRAMGQLGRYSASWKRGPLVLLVCEARYDFGESMVIERVRELRSLGRSVFVVAAGRFAD